MNGGSAPDSSFARHSFRLSTLVFVGYQAIAVVMTWPLVTGLGRDVPGDLGDALLNMWILAWGAEQLPRLLIGQITLQDFWNANIFHPEPLALSFSEQLVGQVLQILPAYTLTGNIILCYNLLFLTSFSLSGLGMFLLVRELLAERWGHSLTTFTAACVAGLIFAFLPYRVAHIAHIQSLSAQWMPLALYGFRRFITTNRVFALAGGSAALLMQHWSCGYYMVFFAPLVPVFVIHQLWTAGRLREWRAWAAFTIAAAAVALGTWPVAALYLEAQRVHGLSRPLGEVVHFSADVYSYLTAPGALRVWGATMQAYSKPEGELFFGVVTMLLASVAVFGALVVSSRVPRLKPGSPELKPGVSELKLWPSAVWMPNLGGRSFSRTLKGLLLALLLLQVAALALIVLSGGFVTSFAGIPLRATNATRIVINALIVLLLLLVLFPSVRARAVTLARSWALLAALLTLLATWLSLGPIPHTRGQLLQVPSLYAWFYDHVPGFGGLRVPARYGMVAGVFVSMLAGGGAALLISGRRRAAAIGGVLAAFVLIESAFAPMAVNITWGGNSVTPPPRVYPADDAPAVYHQLATMPEARVIAEFPFGDLSWELRYVFYSTVHWKRLLNGYSGIFPPGYKKHVASLADVTRNPDGAWQALRDAGTTHVVVHRAAMREPEADAITAWLSNYTAVEIARFPDDDLLYDVDGRW